MQRKWSSLGVSREHDRTVEADPQSSRVNDKSDLDSEAFCDQMRTLQRLLPAMDNPGESPLDSHGSSEIMQSRNLDRDDQVIHTPSLPLFYPDSDLFEADRSLFFVQDIFHRF